MIKKAKLKKIKNIKRNLLEKEKILMRKMKIVIIIVIIK